MLPLAFHISNLTIRTLLSLSEFFNVDKKARHRTETSRARHEPSCLELPNMSPKCRAFQNQHHLSIFHTIDNNKQTRIISDKYSRITNLTLVSLRSISRALRCIDPCLVIGVLKTQMSVLR